VSRRARIDRRGMLGGGGTARRTAGNGGGGGGGGGVGWGRGGYWQAMGGGNPREWCALDDRRGGDRVAQPIGRFDSAAPFPWRGEDDEVVRTQHRVSRGNPQFANKNVPRWSQSGLFASKWTKWAMWGGVVSGLGPVGPGGWGLKSLTQKQDGVYWWIFYCGHLFDTSPPHESHNRRLTRRRRTRDTTADAEGGPWWRPLGSVRADGKAVG